MDDENGSSISRWVVRLAVAALAIGAVAGFRRLAVQRADQDFEEKLRRLDSNRE